ncbi:hypothetical protein BN13_2040002 [Nostocoides jenkinsii Ben 74]|uniref:Uncharacterized protein n=1 Tax=Nostocoides jenkinsii Ben 74 TaxID=1193518 RepID=A0A077M638_9MICO|nr:hypothetical protein BN13_2040002 [Tetrasphaera jenkinsii Ben 74]
MIYSSTNICDKFYNPLGLHICGKSFSPKYAYSRNEVSLSFCSCHFFHLLIPINDAEDI